MLLFTRASNVLVELLRDSGKNSISISLRRCCAFARSAKGFMVFCTAASLRVFDGALGESFPK